MHQVFGNPEMCHGTAPLTTSAGGYQPAVGGERAQGLKAPVIPLWSSVCHVRGYSLMTCSGQSLLDSVGYLRQGVCVVTFVPLPP